MRSLMAFDVAEKKLVRRRTMLVASVVREGAFGN